MTIQHSLMTPVKVSTICSVKKLKLGVPSEKEWLRCLLAFEWNTSCFNAVPDQHWEPACSSAGSTRRPFHLFELLALKDIQ
ncbi:unnamed protein product [Ilex paraguariensis]|uniref:Uncharacterized protein n=1 Tax=Ilex paraguariensis TaxID=185542 RepID=A0ABC8U2X9_9AQUA